MNFVIIITFIAIFFLILLLCREIICWYFKINEKISLLQENNDTLILIEKHLKVTRRNHCIKPVDSKPVKKV